MLRNENMFYVKYIHCINAESDVGTFSTHNISASLRFWFRTNIKATVTNLPQDKMSTITHADDIFKWIFLNEKFCISIQISIQISDKFVPRVQLTTSHHWFRYWLGAEQIINF